MKNILKKSSIILAASLCFPILSMAQISDQSIVNQQDWITRQQQNKIEDDQRLKEQETILKERKTKQKQLDEEDQNKIPVSQKSEECFAIKSIKLVDASSISKYEHKKLVAPFIDKCFSAKNLNEIIVAIQDYYNKKGFITARVFAAKQNIQNGELKLQVLEGKIGEIIIGDDKFSDKMQELTAFPLLEGRALNLGDINQGIYQINRLPSNNAAMKIIPSEIEGEAIIQVQNHQKVPARATIGYDNLGNEFSGIRRTNFAGSFDNLLSVNDAINLSYSTNLDDDSAKKDIKSFSLGASIPFGYNTFSYDFSRTEFRGTNQGINGAILLTGFSQRNNAAIDRVLLNEGNFRLSAQFSLTTKSSASYLNEQKIETSQRKLTIGNFGFTISNYFKNGVNLYLKPTYFKGLKILNAKQDDKNINQEIPKAQFDYFKFYGQISKQFAIPEFISKNKIPFTASTEFDSQYAKQTLFGTEQFGVGGYHSVRGFRENFITGDSGYYLRNKINFNVASLILPLTKLNLDSNDDGEKVNQFQGFLTKNLSYFDKISIEPFFDYGYVKNKYIQSGADGRLSGLGVKTIFSGKYFDASLTYSAAKNHSSLITSPKRENKMVYFEIGAKCC